MKNQSWNNNVNNFNVNVSFNMDQKDLSRRIGLLTYEFTSYHLYFSQKNYYDNNKICSINEIKNNTHMQLSNSVDQCARWKYSPRFLKRDQISWKVRNNEDFEKNGYNNNQDNVKIQRYLVFVMILPYHPYSQDLLEIISTIGPMFPSISVVFGNAYEFNDMCAKYYIHSFPKILFFKSGIFMNTYEDKYDAASLARKFARWTKSLPKSIPLKKKSQKYYPLIQNFISINFLNFSLLSYVPHLYLPIPSSNIEPFLGSVKEYETWGGNLFLISGLFVLIRFLFIIKSFRLY
jgi:hypothetical protein